jgi:zinc D-Ala-D-Ala dipeptidase
MSEPKCPSIKPLTAAFPARESSVNNKQGPSFKLNPLSSAVCLRNRTAPSHPSASAAINRRQTSIGSTKMLSIVYYLLALLLLLHGAESASPKVLPDGFSFLSDVDPTIIQEIRYAGYHNFMGRPVESYLAPSCILTTKAAKQLALAQLQALQMGLSFKVYDCYRPTSAVADFARWALNTSDVATKAEFYPTTDKTQLFDLGYISYNSSHCHGSTIDLTLVKLPAAPQPNYIPGQSLTSCTDPYGVRWQDNSVDMDTGFDCFDTLSNTLDPRVGPNQAANRLILLNLMRNVGFRNYEGEWWHYTLIDEPFPKTSFDFPVVAPPYWHESVLDQRKMELR